MATFKNFRKKSHNAKKTEKDPLGFFNIHSVAKHQKKLKDPLVRKKN